MNSYEKFIVLLVSVLCVAYGVIAINPSLYVKLLKWQNRLRGIRTEISPTTIRWGKINGIFALVFGLFAGLTTLFLIFIAGV
jgi:hypothetical protein